MPTNLSRKLIIRHLNTVRTQSTTSQQPNTPKATIKANPAFKLDSKSETQALPESMDYVGIVLDGDTYLTGSLGTLGTQELSEITISGIFTTNTANTFVGRQTICSIGPTDLSTTRLSFFFERKLMPGGRYVDLITSELHYNGNVFNSSIRNPISAEFYSGGRNRISLQIHYRLGEITSVRVGGKDSRREIKKDFRLHEMNFDHKFYDDSFKLSIGGLNSGSAHNLNGIVEAFSIVPNKKAFKGKDLGRLESSDMAFSFEGHTQEIHNTQVLFVSGTEQYTVDMEVTPPPVVTPPPPANEAPTYSTTNLLTFETDNTVTGADLFRVTATDPESDTITFNITRDNSLFNVSVAGNVATISAAANVPAGNYSFGGTITDSASNSTNFSHTINVAQSAAPTVSEVVYVYGSTRGATTISSQSAALSVLGDTQDVSGSIVVDSPIDKFQGGEIGSQTITVPGGQLSLVASGSLSSMQDFSTLGALDFSSAIQQIVVLYPESGDLADKPASTYNGVLPALSNVPGRATLYSLNPVVPGVVESSVYQFNLNTGLDVNGHSTWNMLYSWSGTEANNVYHIVDDQDNAPT